jgi:hypothetical protein
MTRGWWFVLGTVVLVLVTAGGWFAAMAADGEVPSYARDLDCDGHVSVGEWTAGGLDYGWRRASDGPAECMEVFSLKDGLPQSLWCGTLPRCQSGVVGSLKLSRLMRMRQ